MIEAFTASTFEIDDPAMTVNVFNEDVEQCLASGMNGHIGKPIDFDILFRILGKYLPPKP